MPTQSARRIRNGIQNKIQSFDRAGHDWYRFVLSFPPHLVRKYLEEFELNPSHQVLDPFCGTGTTLVECKKHGIPSVGIEANPLLHFASRIKTDWSPDPNRLLAHAQRIAELTIRELDASGINDDPNFFHKRNGSKNHLRTLSPEHAKLLLKNSISPLPLHKTLVLLDMLKRHRHAGYEGHEQLALARALVFDISNLHFGPEVGLGSLKKDARVIGAWLDCLNSMVHDLRDLEGLQRVPSVAYCEDARNIRTVLEPHSVDAVITSPPYPNEKDYTRTTRLESVLLGFVNDKLELRSLKKELIRSNTRGVYSTDDDDQWILGHPEITNIAERIEARRIHLGKTSGFERLYARVTKLYFGGMAKHLAELRPVLKPGARLAYVVGDQASYLRVMIRTGQILSDIAQTLGYVPLKIDLFRTRLSTVTKEQLREEVIVLQWPGKAAHNRVGFACEKFSDYSKRGHRRKRGKR